ncbi:MAG: arginine--tRNA ligase [Bacteroidales bacterium]|nr:arginine--tRNA ligase [Bacteroidales bacterium]
MIEYSIQEQFVKGFKEIFDVDIDIEQVKIQQTRREIAGDYTVNVFPFVRFARKKPEEVASMMGEYLTENTTEIVSFEVIKGFLNLLVADIYWFSKFEKANKESNFGVSTIDESQKPIVIEYSSPNTNKPLHLGHIRNNLLGFSIAEIMKASGRNVKKVNLVNDRGIHICKSMLAWQKWGGGESPESTGVKGDNLVGKYYVKFDQEYKVEIKNLVDQGIKEEEAKKQAPLMLEAQQMLRDWEAKKPDVYKLWETMNNWVYAGFDVTYKRLGVDFDKIYYESETYLLGKEIVMKGLKDGVLYQSENGAVWADLTKEGLDQKLLLRADGTSVYMTQDIGTAHLRQDDYNPQSMMYVVGNEQIYHFDVLKIVLQKLGFDWSENITHISYGMVELPEGKMKSREGTVVDADDLIDEMVATAEKTTRELGKVDDFSKEEADQLFYNLGLGALKYFLLKVDPKKKMMFNPKESIDFNGNTGPFIQYTHARIQSVIRKSKGANFLIEGQSPYVGELNEKERFLMNFLGTFPEVVQQAANSISPAIIASYAYELSKEYNSFYHDNHIMNEQDASRALYRLELSKLTAKIIATAMKLLGIAVPDRM